jgi:hypothetical protein
VGGARGGRGDDRRSGLAAAARRGEQLKAAHPTPRAPWCACLAALALPLGSAADPVAPFPVRDQNPLLRPFYLPTASDVVGDGWEFRPTLAWSNTVNLPSDQTEQLDVDEETAELNLALLYGAGPWRARLSLPVLARGGGILDGLIDDWHGWFNLTRGDRAFVASNAYRIEYQRQGYQTVSIGRGAALGDLDLEGGRQLLAGAHADLSAWLGLELPTGGQGRSAGNGALDGAAWLAGHTELGARADLFAQAGISHPGSAGLMPAVTRNTGFGTLMLGLRVTNRLTALAQVDHHSAIASASALNFLESATIGTFGVRYRLNRRTAWELAAMEDLRLNHSPDVTFFFGLRQSLGR